MENVSQEKCIQFDENLIEMETPISNIRYQVYLDNKIDVLGNHFGPCLLCDLGPMYMFMQLEAINQNLCKPPISFKNKDVANQVMIRYGGTCLKTKELGGC